MNRDSVNESLRTAGLKITPQRLTILEALLELRSHPTAERIIEYVQKDNPNISVGTIYKTLDTFVEKNLIRKVKTDDEPMRYDAIKEHHHHLYCKECDQIEDYFDEELDQLLSDYFENRKIRGFRIDEIRLQIRGQFSNHKSKKN
jgi:Fur family peroxide stress response transcriptional regulator